MEDPASTDKTGFRLLKDVSIRLAREEFSWKILLVTAVWAAMLFPGHLLGPVRVLIGRIPILIDPSVVLEVLGGILFGVWGGVLSPILSCSVAYGVHHHVPFPVFLVSLPVHVLNGTLIPLARHAYLSRMRRLEPRAILFYFLAGCVLVPMSNGLFYAYFRQFYFQELIPIHFRDLFLTTWLYCAIQLVFPGEVLFHLVVSEARKMGLHLENRWGLWSERVVTFRKDWLLAAAIASCLAPILALSILAAGALQNREDTLRDNWIRLRTYWNSVHGMRLDQSLQQTRTILEVSAQRVRTLIGEPELMDEFLLSILKSDERILNLEYLPLRSSDLETRLGVLAPAGTKAEEWLKGDWFVSPLGRSDGGDWVYVMGRRIQHSEGATAGWLLMRCRGDLVARMVALYGGILPGRSRVVLADHLGRIFFGRDVPTAMPLDRKGQFLNGSDGKRYFVASYSLLGGPWEMVYIEEYEFRPGMREYLAEQGLWSGGIHLSIFSFLVGLTVLARALALGLKPAEPDGVK